MIIGIAGKIASGKTEVLGILKEKGFKCINSDEIVHELYKEGREGQKKIREVFGEKFLLDNGNVNRGLLRELVFSNLEELEKLNSLIHPLVSDEIGNIDLNGNVAIEAAYFDKEHLGKFVDKILFVERNDEEIKKVLMNDRGFSGDMADGVLEFYRKPFRIDYVVENKGSLEDLKLLVEKTLGL